jgi:hypothetical protein
VEKMQCIFLYRSERCTADLPNCEKPDDPEMDEETVKKYCKSAEFQECPRFKAYMEYKEKVTI